jgi:hypothetical protein
VQAQQHSFRLRSKKAPDWIPAGHEIILHRIGKDVHTAQHAGAGVTAETNVLCSHVRFFLGFA